MIRLSKKILIIVSMGLLIVIMLIGKSKASLQSNPNTHYKKIDPDLVSWMVNVRNMEKTGEAMGLNETLNTDLTPESESNNIDVHFLRSTEYGAVAILSASGYGNPQTLQESEIKTTTGNRTGVYFLGTAYEFVAGGAGVTGTVNNRYFDTYTGSITSAKVGDALGNSTTINPGCLGWHGATSAGWILDYQMSRAQFARGAGGLFSYNDPHYTNGYTYGRGVAVCGQGL